MENLVSAPVTRLRGMPALRSRMPMARCHCEPFVAALMT